MKPNRSHEGVLVVRVQFITVWCDCCTEEQEGSEGKLLSQFLSSENPRSRRTLTQGVEQDVPLLPVH
jgi:hypothetical protein